LGSRHNFRAGMFCLRCHGNDDIGLSGGIRVALTS
jgi:hypothetical protein